MRGRVEESFAKRHRAIDVDDDGNAASPRLGAQIRAEFRAAALGENGRAILQQRVGRGQADLPQLRIAECHDGTFAARIDHDARDRRYQARHMHDVLGVDALMRQLLENISGGSFARVAHWPADRGAAAEAYDTDGGVQRIAAADFIKVAGVRFGAACGNSADPKGQIAHGYADTENPRGNFWRS